MDLVLDGSTAVADTMLWMGVGVCLVCLREALCRSAKVQAGASLYVAGARAILTEMGPREIGFAVTSSDAFCSNKRATIIV
jgi:hypothetical protein